MCLRTLPPPLTSFLLSLKSVHPTVLAILQTYAIATLYVQNEEDDEDPIEVPGGDLVAKPWLVWLFTCLTLYCRMKTMMRALLSYPAATWRQKSWTNSTRCDPSSRCPLAAKCSRKGRAPWRRTTS